MMLQSPAGIHGNWSVDMAALLAADLAPVSQRDKEYHQCTEVRKLYVHPALGRSLLPSQKMLDAYFFIGTSVRLASKQFVMPPAIFAR